MSKMLKKIICCLLTATMVIGMLAGCGQKETNTSESKKESSAVSESKTESKTSEAIADNESNEIIYPLEGDITLSIAMVQEAAVVANAKDLLDTPFGKAWQEQTGVTIEMIQLADSNAMNLLFASGELPDIIYYNMSSYTGGTDKAVKDGVILPINDYMEFAPDLQAALDSNEDWRRGNTTNSGDIVGFPFIRGDEYLKTSAGLMMRADWLEDLNMEVPNTPDEMYEVLKKFKEEKGAEYPLGLNLNWLYNFALNQGIFTSPFGLVTANFYVKDGEVHWGATEPEYKAVLEYFHKLYKEGLLDSNFATMDQNTVNANIMNGVSGAAIGSTGGGMGTYITTMQATDPTYDLVGVGSLVAKDGDTPMYTFYDNAITGMYAVITPACKNVEAAMKFLNWGYTEEGSLLMHFGIEGESYEMVDGEPVYTDLIQNNPNGLPKQQAQALYCRTWTAFPFVQREAASKQSMQLDQQVAALEQWTNSDAARYVMPRVSVADESVAEYTQLYNDAATYIQEMTTKYIQGEESLDNFESEYMATLESKLQIDRILELQQEAVDLYYAR